MAKIVYNACFGGFSLSDAALALYAEIKGLTEPPFDHNIARDDKALVMVVEQLGEAANGRFAALEIAEVPAGSRWRIDEYDGAESVMTLEDYEWNVAVD